MENKINYNETITEEEYREDVVENLIIQLSNIKRAIELVEKKYNVHIALERIIKDVNNKWHYKIMVKYPYIKIENHVLELHKGNDSWILYYDDIKFEIENRWYKKLIKER